MKPFLTKISIFVLILLGYTSINFLINRELIRQKKVPIREEVNVLIAGDSHSGNAMDPNFFVSARNISQNAEPYVITFWKLKHIFNEIEVDTLFLGFSHHSLSTFNDYKFIDKKWSPEMFQRSYPIQNFAALKDIPVDYNVFYRIYFRNMCLYPKFDHFNFIGSYNNVDHTDISNLEKVIARHFHYNGIEMDISEKSVAYLDSILAICNKQGVKPILLGSPVHESYYREIPDRFKEKYQKVKSRLEEEGVAVIDMTDRFYREELFLDADHLNEKGAEKFTQELLNKFE